MKKEKNKIKAIQLLFLCFNGKSNKKIYDFKLLSCHDIEDKHVAKNENHS